MKLITASELRTKEHTIEEIIEFLNECATKAKNEKRTSYKTYGPDSIFGKIAFYGLNEKYYPDNVKKTLSILRESGFDARIRAEELQLLQFINIFLYVEW